MPRNGGNKSRGGYQGWGGGNQQQEQHWAAGQQQGGRNRTRGQPQSSVGQYRNANTRQQDTGLNQREIVQNDLQTERPLWVLSCYASEREYTNDLAYDISPEEVRWANMQSAVLHQAAPHQLAAEFKAARHAKLDQFKALMQARVLPSAGGPALGPPQVSIQGLTTSSESVSTIGLPFSNATATGQQATREEQAGPSRGQHVHQAQEFGQPGSFQPQSSFVAGATPASQPSSQQHGFGTAFGQTGGMSKPSFGTAATGMHGSGARLAGGGFGSTPFAAGSMGAGMAGASTGTSVFGGAQGPPQGLPPGALNASSTLPSGSGFVGARTGQQPLTSRGPTMLFGKQISGGQGSPFAVPGPATQLGVPPLSTVSTYADTADSVNSRADPIADQQRQNLDGVWLVSDFARGGIPEEPPPQMFCQC